MRRTSVDKEISQATAGLAYLKTFGDDTFALASLGRDARTVLSKRIWAQTLPNWASLRASGRVDRLVWFGIPPSLRGEVWALLLGNQLKITTELYHILHSRATQTQPLDLILQDVPRTFPDLHFFHDEGPLRQPLQQLLAVYTTYRPDIGYVQGMSFLAAILLLHTDSQAQAFTCFCNLLNTDFYFSLYHRRDSQQTALRLHVFQELFRKVLPRLFVHFELLQVTPDLYLWEWMVTLYSKCLFLDTCLRVWDNLFFRGQSFVFRTALGILRTCSSRLLQAESFEECMKVLGEVHGEDEEQLFEEIQSVEFSEVEFRQVVYRVRERQASKGEEEEEE